MKEFRSLERQVRPRFPRFICSELERGCGHDCGRDASWWAPWSADGLYVRTYCDDHKPANAEQIPLEAGYLITRVELRVAVPHLPADPFNAADQAVRKMTEAVEAAGGLVVGLRVVGQKADSSAVGAPPLRLELAGRPTPAVRPDRPFWGILDDPPWLRAWRRRKTG